MSLLVGVFAMARVAAVWHRAPQRFPDSPGYLKIDFLGHAERLWTVPLLFRPLPSDEARLIAQTALAIACWSALAYAAARTVRDPVMARLGPALVLIVGLCVEVTEWDVTILSESTAISLSALLVALLLRLRASREPRLIVATLAALTLWTFTRQLQAGVVIPLAIVAAAWLLIRSRRHLPIAAAVLAIAAWSGYADSQAHAVTAGTAHDLLVFRIFPTAGGPAFFASRGMPDIAGFQREAAAGVYLGVRSPTRNDPTWLAWVRRHWLPSYAAWLASRPASEIGHAATLVPGLLSGFPDYGNTRVVLPSAVQDAVWGRQLSDILAWFIVQALLLLAALPIACWRAVSPVAAALVGAALLWYFVGYLFGQTELPRIWVPAAALLRIGFILLGITALGVVLRRRVVRHERAPRSLGDASRLLS